MVTKLSYLSNKRLSSQLSVALMLSLLISPALQAREKSTPLVVAGAVETATIIEEMPLSGTVTSPQVSQISSEVSGIIKQLHVDAGSVVGTGDLLVELDPELQNLEYRATLANTRRAKEELADAIRRLEDARRLAKQKTISENERQSLQSEVNIAAAAVKRFEAEQALQEARIARHQITAPFNGVISNRLVSIGQWIQPGTGIVQLVATDNLTIDFQVPQRIYPRINDESEIEIMLDSIPDKKLSASIKTLVPYSDASSRTMLIRTVLDNAETAVVPGMSASAVLKLRGNSEGTVVSRDAILRYPDGRITAWVIKQQEGEPIVEERHIKLGLTFSGKVEILEGLNPGEQVVIEGNESLRNKQAVRVSEN